MTIQNDHLDLLKELIAIPSVSAKEAYLPEAAKRIATALEDLGAEVPYDDTYFAPLVFGKIQSPKPDAQTFIRYNHYDVQPAEPFDLWHSDPEITRVVKSVEKVYDTKPVVAPTAADTGPMYYVHDVVKAPIAALGIGYTNNLDYAPNENIRLSDYRQHIEVIKALIASYQQ